MRKTMLLACCLTGVIQANAQKIYTGLTAAPELHSVTFKSNTSDPSLKRGIDELNNSVTGAFGCSIGITGGISLSKRLSLEANLALQMAGFNTKPYIISIDPGAPATTSFEEKFRLYYINIPLMVNYKVVSVSRFNFYASAGVVNSILIGSERKGTRTNQQGQTSRVTDDIIFAEGYKLAAMASVGAEFNVAPKLYIRAAPSFQYDIIAGWNKNSAAKGYFWNTGLNCSVIYKR